MTGVSGATAFDDGPGAPLAGAALLGALESVDVAALDDHDLLEYLAATERVAARAASLQLSAAAELARRPARIEAPGLDRAAATAGYARPGVWVREFADDEVAARLRISSRDAASRIRLGCALNRLPCTSSALHEGTVDVRRARVVVDETAVLDLASARSVDRVAAADAARLPAARLRAKVRRLVLAADPLAARARERVARDDRRVVITPVADGMAELWALLPAAGAMAVDAALRAASRASRVAAAPGDDRTMDQRRADHLVSVFVEALATGRLGEQQLATHRGRPAELQVTVAATTLLGLDDAPAELRGYGPISADAARRIAPDARWRRILTDPVSGTVLDVGTTTYRPPAALQRHVEIRDQRCTFPGCGALASASELDHTVPFPAGPTAAHNLAARCGRHHRLKHAGPVTVEQLPDGTSRWTMPTGHQYDVPRPSLAEPHQPRDSGTPDEPPPRSDPPP